MHTYTLQSTCHSMLSQNMPPHQVHQRHNKKEDEIGNGKVQLLQKKVGRNGNSP